MSDRDEAPAPQDPDDIVDLLCDLTTDERTAWFDAHPLPADVRRKVDQVLGHYDELKDAPDAMPASGALKAVADELGEELRSGELLRRVTKLPERIGSYKIVGVVGAGGMGIVYEAEQAQPRRRVAVKVLRAGLVSEEHRRRFQREASFLGKLQHPGIAQVFELGRTDDGGVFLAMEFIRGERITGWAEVNGLDRDARLGLLAELADAVHHAHLRGVLHRDLKPGNVLVTEEGQVKVIDFGVARALDQDDHKATLETSAGQIVGTLAYMSPEQVRGVVDEIDARADVYALGVLAYELLSRRLPLDVKTLTLTEAARVVADVDPPRLGSHAPECRGDVELVVAKALAKEPERRYDSAAAFAADLRRLVAREAVEARAPTTFYQLRTFTRRNRTLVGGVAATLLAVVVGAAVAVHQALENKELARLEGVARDAADRSAQEARDEAVRAATLAEEAGRQAQLARDAAAEAELARAAEAERAEELALVAKTQERLLFTTDMRHMAASLEEDLVEVLRRDLDRRGLDPAQRDQLVETFAGLLRFVDLQDVASRAVDRSLLQPAVQRFETAFSHRPAILAGMLSALASAQEKNGQSLVAEGTRRRAVQLLEESLGPRDPQTMREKFHLTTSLKNLGKREEVREIQEQLLVDMVEVLGEHHAHTVDLFAGLAGTLHYDGDVERAFELYDRALAAAEVLEAEGDSYSTKALRPAYARALMVEARLEEAEVILREVVERSRVDIERNWPPALGHLASLGFCIFNQEGREDEARAMIEEARDRTIQRLGSRNPRSLKLGVDYAQMLMHLEEVDEAVAVLEDAVEGFGELEMVDDLARARGFLARAHRLRGDEQAALAVEQAQEQVDPVGGS